MEIKNRFITKITYVDEEGIVHPKLNKNRFIVIQKIKERGSTNRHWRTIEYTYVIGEKPEQLSLFET